MNNNSLMQFKNEVPKFLKKFFLIKIIITILWILIFSSYFIYLFNVWIYNYFWIHSSYLNLNQYNLMVSTHLILVNITLYVFLVSPILFLLFFLIKGEFKHKFKLLIFLSVISIFYIFWSNFNLKNWGTYLYLIVIFFIPAIYYLFRWSQKNRALFFYNIVLTTSLLIYFSIFIFTSWFVFLWENWASINTDKFQYQIFVLDNQEHIIFWSDDNFFVTKRLEEDVLLWEDVYLIGKDKLDWIAISERSIDLSIK